MHAHLFEALPVGRQHTARDAGAVAALSRLGIAPVDRPVGVECRTQRDVEQAALAACIDGRHAGNRRPQLARCRDDAQATGLLRDEQVAAGERLHGPRLVEPLGEHDDVERDVRGDGAGARLAGERRALVGRVGLAGFERRARGGRAGPAVTSRLRPGIVRRGCGHHQPGRSSRCMLGREYDEALSGGASGRRRKARGYAVFST